MAHGSMDKLLVKQTQGPEFGSPSLHKNLSDDIYISSPNTRAGGRDGRVLGVAGQL